MYVRYFPFDTQECVLTFGSWTQTKNLIDYHLVNPTVLFESYVENEEWRILSFKMNKEEVCVARVRACAHTGELRWSVASVGVDHGHASDAT
jgi:hypothetical protein